MSELSRRRLLGLAGAGTAGMLAAGAAGAVVGHATDVDTGSPSGPAPDDAVPFTGRHQAGIVTPAQDRLHFVAFDVTTGRRDELVAMLKAWTEAARRMTAGKDAGPAGAVDGDRYAPPDDTGEAVGLPASGLTLTIGGDLCIQACADDPQVAVHAVRNLVRLGAGVVGVRWSQLGFGRTSSTSTGQSTPRNLFGFKDGTNNLKAENDAALDRFVWVGDGDSGADWLAGGSYLVARRIRMLIEPWDTSTLDEQQQTIGRTKGVGAPLGQRAEFDPVDVAKQVDGRPAIPPTSHVFLAHPANAGTAILRRGYSFVDGSDGLGRLDAGLFFLAYQRDPEAGFVQVQRNLRTDAMNEYIRHTSSAVFACPPGLRDDADWWGRTLLG
jgi:deferrochelatase/peroxidase EfeB